MRKNENENGNFKFIEGAQVTKTDTEGIQNQHNLRTVHMLMPTLNLKKKWKFKIFATACKFGHISYL